LATAAADTPAEDVEQAFMSQAGRWPNPPTNWRHTTVAGAPALRYHLSGQSLDGKPQEAEAVAVFHGAHLVYVSCNWKVGADTETALSACDDVLKSLRIEG
jgi:hypothetical protein